MKSVRIIAEVGSVHDGSFGNACRLIDLAKDSGADVVKFQTHIASAETLRNAPMPPYFRGEPRYAYFERTGFTPEQWSALKRHCDQVGIDFLSSPFSIEAVELLERIGVSAYKIASGEVTNTPMLERIAETGKAVILSSGMSNWCEIDKAVTIFREAMSSFCVMQCSSIYPCPPEKTGLNVLGEILARYPGVVAGFSDHTESNTAAIGAVFSGAGVIEKHLTFSKAMYGSDAANAAEPREFKALVSSVREAEIMLRSRVDKTDASQYAEMRKIFQKSIVAARPLPAGSLLAKEHFAYKKPGDGISAARFREIAGRRLRVAIATDQPILESDLE